jgi:hypothetical protein
MPNPSVNCASVGKPYFKEAQTTSLTEKQRIIHRYPVRYAERGGGGGANLSDTPVMKKKPRVSKSRENECTNLERVSNI